MRFSDEFEHEVEGVDYTVSVEGEVNKHGEIDVDYVCAYDSNGDPLDEDHDHYGILSDEAHSREYTPEIHNTDFDYYEADINGFLRET